MSWSFTAIGKPSNMAAALQKHSTTLTDQCKIEFDDALPHLIGLVEQNFSESENNQLVIKLNASGSGYSRPSDKAGEKPRQVQRSCTVSIEAQYINLV